MPLLFSVMQLGKDHGDPDYMGMSAAEKKKAKAKVRARADSRRQVSSLLSKEPGAAKRHLKPSLIAILTLATQNKDRGW